MAGGQEAVLTWRDEGTTLGDALVVAVVPGANEEVLGEDNEMTLWCIAIIVKRQDIQNISALLKEKPARCAHVSATFPDDEQLRHQYEQFQMFQQQNTQVIFLCNSRSNRYSYLFLTLSVSHTWIIDSRRLIT